VARGKCRLRQEAEADIPGDDQAPAGRLFGQGGDRVLVAVPVDEVRRNEQRRRQDGEQQHDRHNELSHPVLRPLGGCDGAARWPRPPWYARAINAEKNTEGLRRRRPSRHGAIRETVTRAP